MKKPPPRPQRRGVFEFDPRDPAPPGLDPSGRIDQDVSYFAILNQRRPQRARIAANDERLADLGRTGPGADPRFPVGVDDMCLEPRGQRR